MPNRAGSDPIGRWSAPWSGIPRSSWLAIRFADALEENEPASFFRRHRCLQWRSIFPGNYVLDSQTNSRRLASGWSSSGFPQTASRRFPAGSEGDCHWSLTTAQFWEVWDEPVPRSGSTRSQLNRRRPAREFARVRPRPPPQTPCPPGQKSSGPPLRCDRA